MVDDLTLVKPKKNTNVNINVKNISLCENKREKNILMPRIRSKKTHSSKWSNNPNDVLLNAERSSTRAGRRIASI
jgi:hypothetical protein